MTDLTPEILTKRLQAFDTITRWDAAEELVRTLAAREADLPRLLAEQRTTVEDAALRLARLATAWAYTVDPALTITGPHRYRTTLQLAEWLAEARGWKPSTNILPFNRGSR